MIQHLQAVYENGVFRPLEPIDVPDRAVVSLAILDDDEQLDDESDDYVSLLVAEGDPSITLEQVQEALSCIPGSLADFIISEREERF